MYLIGGELPVQQSNLSIYFSDSGRSSLRLFLRSDANRYKKYLLPDFLCEIIENIFIEEKVQYQTYHVFKNLSIDNGFINNTEFDVLYIINYFGQYLDLSNLNIKDKILIEDNVFFSNFENRTNHTQWFGFNSFRKISPLADGSMIKTNLLIKSDLILKKESPFSKIKYEAKSIKFNYLKFAHADESTYLKKFVEGEEILNQQNKLYSMSSLSQSLLLEQNFSSNQTEQKRFKQLFEIFPNLCLNSSAKETKFFILFIENRDKLRKKLFKKNIFLPIHWPKSTNNNILYDKVISIPLFHIYTDEEFNFMIQEIKKLIC